MIRDDSSNRAEQESQSQVYFMAYELVNIDPTRNYFMYEDEAFWKYRPHISFELMSIELNKSKENQETHKILKTFADKFYQLQLLANLPQMVNLVNLLISQLNKSVYKPVAQEMTIEEFIQQFPEGLRLYTFAHY